MTVAITDRRTIDHAVRIPVTENTPSRMYLRTEIAKGSADDGTPIAVDSTGPHIIIYLGVFPNGRQFVVNVSDMAKAVLEQLTQPGV